MGAGRQFFVAQQYLAVHFKLRTKGFRVVAHYRVGGYVDEMMGGISQLETLRELLKQAEEDWPSLLARLERIRNTILDQETCRNGMFFRIYMTQVFDNGTVQLSEATTRGAEHQTWSACFANPSGKCTV